MQKTREKNEKPELLKASIIFALVVIAAFAPVVFLDQTYYRNTPIPPEFLGYENKTTIFGVTADYSDIGVWPYVKLATEQISNGNIPLWNPHAGIGTPLGADSTFHIFSPYNLGFFLPSSLWDVPILIGVWLAGFFTFLFLRSLKLKFFAAVTGGICFMLSGGITWYLTNPNFLVVMMTPLILYSLEKIIQNRDPRFITVLSISFLLTILAGHLETIVLQFVFVGIYFFYRIIIKGNYSKRIDRKKLSVVFFCLLGFFIGLGLSMFFILPVYELIDNNILEHEPGIGLSHYSTINVITSFVPYALGQINAYWIGPAAGLIGFWGYVGIFALFFSILGVYLSLKNKDDKVHRFTPLFFVCVSIFFIMKTIGVPIANWIGYLPILDILTFTNYLGVIIPFGFAVSLAFGINLLPKIKISVKTLGIILFLTISIVLLLLIPLYSHLQPDSEFPGYVSADDARNYVGFQTLQAILFAIMAFAIAVAITKNRSAVIIVIPLVLLELSLYIPVGLHPIFLAYKFIILFIGITALTLLSFKPNKFTWDFDTNEIKLPIIFGILIIVFIGGLLISEFSSFGMMKKMDSFEENPITEFLKDNLGEHRMFSFDYTMGPNYPSAYGINSIGLITPFTIDSFKTFSNNFLDADMDSGRLGFPPWTYSYGPMESIKKFSDNKKYYDFLGVKYVITQGYSLDSIATGIPGNTREFSEIKTSESSVSQKFISPVETITSLGVSVSAFQLVEDDEIVLSINSIPYDEKFTRTSVLKHVNNQKYNQFNIEPALENVQHKELIFSLHYPQVNDEKFLVVHTINEKESGFDYIKNELKGIFYENDSEISAKQMIFSITSDSNENNMVFQFEDIFIHENTDIFPRVFLVNDYEIVEKDTAHEYLLQNPSFDLRQKVILEGDLPNELRKNLELSNLNENDTAEIVAYEYDNIVIETKSNNASLLILTDIYYPGWTVYVNGIESEIYRADGLVRAVYVPEGTHTVEFAYLPTSYEIGIIISVITAFILVAIHFVSRHKYRRQKIEKSE